MAGEWEETTVGELVTRGILERPLDGNHGSIHPRGQDFVASGVPFIMASDLVGGGIDTVNCSFITIEQAKSLRKGFAKRGDVLLSHKATLGRTAMVGEIPGDFVILTPQVTYYRAKDPTRLSNRYLKFYFDSEFFQQVLRSWAGAGSTRAYIGITDQLRLPIVLPPLPEQRAIAHILGTLDDKIDLNRRMNETLEAMARALFKSWFVDFDPVRAKAEGRDPGLPKHIADLFPDSFEDSELGETPKGWELRNLADFALMNPESWSKEARPSTINYVDLSSTKWGYIDTITLHNQKDAPSRAQRVLRPGDTIVGTVRPGNGSYAFISADGLTGSTGFAVMRPRRHEWSQFVYLAATAAENIEALAHLADGGAYPAVRPEVVIATQVIRADEEILAQFSRFTEPLFAKMAQNEHESRILSNLRDTLLPKLISGDLRLRDAERFLEDRSL